MKTYLDYLIKTTPKETNAFDYTRRNIEKFFSQKKEDNLVYLQVQATFDEKEGWIINSTSDIYFLPVKFAEEFAPPEVYKLLKPDLLDGEDIYLVDTYDHTESSFCFDMYAYNVSYDPDCHSHIVFGEAYLLALAITENNITHPSIMTIKNRRKTNEN